MAWRSTGSPSGGGYWLTPPRMAATAASSTSAGPSVSGKPCPRLMAPVAIASEVISPKIVVPKPSSLAVSGDRARAGAVVTPAIVGNALLTGPRAAARSIAGRATMTPDDRHGRDRRTSSLAVGAAAPPGLRRPLRRPAGLAHRHVLPDRRRVVADGRPHDLPDAGRPDPDGEPAAVAAAGPAG